MTKDITESQDNIILPNTTPLIQETSNSLTTDQLKKYISEKINRLDIDRKIKSKLIENLNYKTKSQSPEPLEELKKVATVLDIIQTIVLDRAEEVFKGAHVMVKDCGKLYDELVEKGIVKERYSSHHNDKKVPGAKDTSLQAGEIFREFLVGKTTHGETWFQVEAHSLGGIKNFFAHLIDYLKYKITGKNVGQYGLSAHTDMDPIRVEDPQKTHVDRLSERAKTSSKELG